MKIIEFPPDNTKYKENENKWMKYKKWYIKAHPLELKEVAEKEILELKNYKLIAVYRPWRMGVSYCNFAILQDDWIHFYTTDNYSHDGYGAVIKTFPGFERDGDKEAKDYEWIYIWFWGWLFISKDIYKDYSDFVDLKCKDFDLWTPRNIRYNREPVMKMYFDDKENSKVI